jgi:hypothetical protein
MTKTIPSRRGFLAVLSAGAASVAVPAVALTTKPRTETPLSGLAPAVASPSPDAALLQLGDEYMAAQSEYRRLCAIFERGKKEHQAKFPMPDAMLVQPGDAELGLPDGVEDDRFGLSYFCRIDQLARPDWPVFKVIEPPEGLRFSRSSGGEVICFGPPSATARARADEIIAAHDKWEAKYWHYPRKLRSIERQADRADKVKDRLRAKIDRTRALTVAGLAVKAQVAAIEGEDDTQFADTTLASILRDMKAINGRTQS